MRKWYKLKKIWEELKNLCLLFFKSMNTNKTVFHHSILDCGRKTSSNGPSTEGFFFSCQGCE